MLALAGNRLDRGQRYNVLLPYGPTDWTVLVLHGFWDSWLHERDILLARGRAHPTDADATGYAAAYGLFIAAAVASMFGSPVPSQQLTLSGGGGGVFDLDTRGAVTLKVTRAAVGGPPAAEVTDALGGRSPVSAVLSHLPASTRTALSQMPASSTHPPRPARPEPGSTWQEGPAAAQP